MKVFAFDEATLAGFSPAQRDELEAIFGSAAGVMPTTPTFHASPAEFERIIGAAPMNGNASH